MTFFVTGNAIAAISCESLFLAKPKNAVTQTTVQDLVQSTFDRVLQSSSVQSEFQRVVAQLRSTGYEANAQMIERLGLLKSRETHYEPTFANFIKNMNAILAEKLPSAGIKIGLVFHKAQDFDRNNPDHWISLEPHQQIPSGYKMFEDRGFLPGAALWSSLARGHFPAMFMAGSINSPTIIAKATAHDLLGHIPTYLLNPEYAASYVKVAQTIMQKYREQTALNGKPSWSFIFKTGLFARVYIFNEGLTKSRPEFILDNMELFGLGGFHEIPRAKDLILKQLTPTSRDLAELNAILKQLVELTPQISRPIGGAALVSTQARTPISNYLDYLVSIIYPRLIRWQTEAKPEDQIQLVAKMIGIIRGGHISTSQINFDQLAVDIFRDQPSRNSPMLHYFSEQAGFFSATKEVVDTLGIISHAAHFGDQSLYNTFTDKGWNEPLPKDWVKAH